MASPVFKTGVTRHRRAGWVRFPHSPAIVCSCIAAACLAVGASDASAQQATAPPEKLGGVSACIPVARDTSDMPRVPRVVIAGPVERRLPLCRVPISPRTAFLRSLLAPGLAQRNLERPKAATFFMAIEAGTIGMAIKSASDLSKAKAARDDTILVAVLDPGGQPVVDPVTGVPQMVSAPRDKNLADRVKARRTHLEDWLAAIVFNHLFAGADAYVAANLADFNTNVQATSTGRGLQVLARITW